MVKINKDTQALTSDSRLLQAITIRHLSQAPAANKKTKLVGAPCELGPSGATFDPPATIILTYDQSTVPEDISANNLSVAYFDDTKGEWVAMKSQLDSASTAVNASISHFSIYGLIARPAGFDWRILPVVFAIFVALVALAAFFVLQRRKQLSAIVRVTPDVVYLLPAPKSALEPGRVNDMHAEPLAPTEQPGQLSARDDHQNDQ